MGWFILAKVFSVLITILRLNRSSAPDKDLEIIVLRQQLAILQRKQAKPLKPNRTEKMILAVLTTQLKNVTQKSTRQLRTVIRIFQPETVLGWHRALVRLKWSYLRQNPGGRPSIDSELENLIVRLAEENPRWGYGKIEGELLKLDYRVSQSTIRNVLKRHNILPAPVRNGSLGWRRLMSHYQEQILACDFFTVETIRLQTLYVFFFIELGTRQVYLAGITPNPNELWVTQQARQIVWELEARENSFRFLIRDNDSKFGSSFDTVFETEDIYVIPTPYRAPNANACAERWVRTVREECLDHILILNEAHLKRVLQEFVTEYYNTSRPHQGLGQRIPQQAGDISPLPDGNPNPQNTSTIQCRQVLGGIINDYYRHSAVNSSPTTD